MDLTVDSEEGEDEVFVEFNAFGEGHANLWRGSKKDQILNEGFALGESSERDKGKGNDGGR